MFLHTTKNCLGLRQPFCVCKSDGIFWRAPAECCLLCIYRRDYIDLKNAPAKFMMQSCKFFPRQRRRQRRRMRQRSLQGYRRDNDDNNGGGRRRRRRRPTAAAAAAAEAAAAAVAQRQEVGSIDNQGSPRCRRWLRRWEAKARQRRQQQSRWHRPRRRRVQRGPRWGGASPPPPPLPPRAIDSSGGAACRGVLPPGAARGQSRATKGECQITHKSQADIFWT
jgi:hypothetical protein